MIIYGWGNFNRRDHGVVRDTCQSCGRRGPMPSYTSSKFFTLYFIPLIPLGTQKIVSECPHCKQARGMSLRKWKKLRQTTLPAAVAAYEASPTNEEAAKQVLGTIIALEDRASLRRIGPQIRTAFEKNAPVLTFLAGTYDHLCLDAEADEVYLAALSLSDDAALAAEANAHMELQKLPRPPAPNRLLQSLPVLIVPAALVFLVAHFAQQAFTSRIPEAYVLSGLDHAYTATINGQSVALGPHRRVPVEMLVYGKNEIAPTAESPFIVAQTFSIDVPWYRRPFENSLVVVNPDQAAVLLWERSGYAYPKAPESAYDFKLAAGRVSHVYADIDFSFVAFPENASVPEDGSVVYKTRVSDFGARDTMEVVRILLGHDLADDMQRYLSARLRATDDDANLIFTGARLLPREEFVRLAEPRLVARPVVVQWHRAYQQVVEGRPEGRDLIARYRAFVQQEPASSELLYLLSRIVEDLDEGVALLQRAAALTHPTAYASFGLAYRHMLDGDFASALASYDEALRIEPGNAIFASMRITALYGLRDYATVERESANVLTMSNPDINACYEHLYRLGKLDRVPLARSEIPLFLQSMQKDEAIPEERLRLLTAYLESALDIATRDRAAFGATAARAAHDSWRLKQAIVAGNLDEAVQVAKATPDDVGLLDHLTLYILLQRAARPEDAAAQLEQAITMLADGDADQQRWMAWLRGDTAPDARQAAHACDSPETHGVLLYALAQKFPTQAGEYLARAAAMKCKDTYYSLALDPEPPR